MTEIPELVMSGLWLKRSLLATRRWDEFQCCLDSGAVSVRA